MHASDGDSKVSTIGQAGDIAHSRVWRKLRKASDMHEHEKEMKRFWAQGRGKEYGRVFVKRASFATSLPRMCADVFARRSREARLDGCSPPVPRHLLRHRH